MDESHPIKVLMLASSYPRRRDDTASVFLRYLAENLHTRGVAVYMLAPADQEAGTTSENGVIVERFRYLPRSWQKLAYGSGILPNLKRNPLLWLQVPFFIVSMTFSLLKLLRKVRPQLLHAHWVIPQGFIALLAKRLYRIPTVITAHGGDAFALKSGLLEAMKRSCLRHSDAWTSNTRGTSNALVGDGSLPPPYIIPMGVNVQHFASGNRQRLRQEIPADSYVVLFVGRLVEKKGVDDLIKAYLLLPIDLRLKTKLWIVGSGEQQKMVQTLASQLGTADGIKFWGKIANDRLPDFYAAADLFVGPSVVAESGDTEGQGVVFLEAFAARLCVLATRTGGIAEVVEDGRTGILVEPRNPNQLAADMEKLLADPQMRASLATNAHDRAKKHYDWARVAMEFEALYRRVI